jgi:hypothetical protein
MKKIALLLVLIATPALTQERVPVRLATGYAKRASAVQQAEGVHFLVHAAGIVGTAGWSDPVLVPRNGGKLSSDGFLEFDFTAIAPTGSVAQVPLAIDATLPIREFKLFDVEGVRIYGAEGTHVYHKFSRPK